MPILLGILPLLLLGLIAAGSGWPAARRRSGRSAVAEPTAQATPTSALADQLALASARRPAAAPAGADAAAGGAAGGGRAGGAGPARARLPGAVPAVGPAGRNRDRHRSGGRRLSGGRRVTLVVAAAAPDDRRPTTGGRPARRPPSHLTPRPVTHHCRRRVPTRPSPASEMASPKRPDQNSERLRSVTVCLTGGLGGARPAGRCGSEPRPRGRVGRAGPAGSSGRELVPAPGMSSGPIGSPSATVISGAGTGSARRVDEKAGSRVSARVVAAPSSARSPRA